MSSIAPVIHYGGNSCYTLKYKLSHVNVCALRFFLRMSLWKGKVQSTGSIIFDSLWLQVSYLFLNDS